MSGYPSVLKYFMWEWQVYFRISCETTAEALFNHLDRGLRPSTFFVGLLSSDSKDRQPVCIEPENIEYTPNTFADVAKVASEILENDPDSKMFYTGPGVQEEMDNRRRLDSYRKAIEQIVNSHPSSTDKIAFVSSPVEVNGYQVYLVLQLRRSIVEKHFILRKTLWNDVRLRLVRSIVETSVDVYLSEVQRLLSMPDPGKRLSGDFKSNHALLREAAINFMYSIAAKGSDFHGLHGLFDSCESISTMYYEGAPCEGEMLIVRKDHSDLEMEIILEEDFRLSNHRKARKFLRLSENNLSVISNSYVVVGLGRVSSEYDLSSESIMRIVFRGVHCWDVLHGEDVLLQMKFGVPFLPSEVIEKQNFRDILKRLFVDVQEEDIQLLYEMSVSITKLKKGAMLVICADAELEAKRLENQCIRIKPAFMDPELFSELTSVDGAILVDVKGVVYAHGLILDGIVGVKGDSARGSRYNSAITYQEFRGTSKPTMIVIVSDDGMVDLVPQLMPRIRHSEIVSAINAMEKLNSIESFDRGSFYQIHDWLRIRQFYLTQEECEKVNHLTKELEAKDKIVGDHQMWVVHEELVPNREMNDTYYLIPE